MENFKKAYTRTHQVVSTIFYNLVLVGVVLALISFMGGIIQGQEGTVFGNKPIYVLTGSMEPEMRTQSIVIAHKVEPENVQVGDIVTYRILDEENAKEMKVTHRVVKVNSEDKTLITKGDANDHNDFDPVPFSNVEYKVTHIYNWFADFIQFVSSTQGLIILISGGVGIWLLLHVAHSSMYDPKYEMNLFRKKEEIKEQAQQEAYDVDLDDEK